MYYGCAEKNSLKQNVYFINSIKNNKSVNILQTKIIKRNENLVTILTSGHNQLYSKVDFSLFIYIP